jgi:hypothetical protein
MEPALGAMAMNDVGSQSGKLSGDALCRHQVAGAGQSSHGKRMNAEATALEQGIASWNDRCRVAHHADIVTSLRLAACEIADMAEQPADRSAEDVDDAKAAGHAVTARTSAPGCRWCLRDRHRS